jgi:signal transduction histidine kinase
VDAPIVVLVLAVAVVAAVVGALISSRRGAAAMRRTTQAVSDRLREEVRDSREQQQVRDLILSSMQEGVLLIGEEGRVEFANAALERHLRMRPATLSSVLPLGLREAVERAAREEEAVSVEVEAGSPSRWLRGTAVPAVGTDSVLLVVRDVTEAKQIDSIRRDFVANASHELKTPAASIQATAETIRRAADDDPPVLPRFAEQLEREAYRLSRIVEDLLDLSRLEAGSDLGELVRVDSLIREEAGRFDDAIQAADVSLEIDATSVPPVRGAPRDLALMVRNLVDNAIRYTKPGGRIEVAVVEGSEGEVVLKVADTGMGIPSRELPRIFERFYRVDRARSRETGGTGLGLAIVKHVVENHGGEITVESELGRGTRFEIRLPSSGAISSPA